jgi:hypothetical protein
MPPLKWNDMHPSPQSGYVSTVVAQLHSAMGELRILFGIHIARIVCAYASGGNEQLDIILPLRI